MRILQKTEQWLTQILEHGNTLDSDIIAKAYDQAMDSWLDRALLKLRAKSFNPRYLAKHIEKLAKQPTGEITCLDVGCNIGAKTNLILEILKSLGCSKVAFHGIDLSEKAIAIIKKSNKHSNATYKVADFLTMNLKEDSYDYIFLTAVWHHIKDQEEAIKKIEKALKPGGLGIIFNGFYPENIVLRIPSLLLQKFYRLIVKRNGLRYTKPLISSIEKLVSKKCKKLKFLGNFSTGFPTNILNTRMLILTK
ncbi:MAG: methyltransferase domain-containing protein [Candidatus Peregrinibacteria bacterium]|nr:methyltransferase domain-containing protein [Candidatus Peregrinibacteria bacterium]